MMQVRNRLQRQRGAVNRKLLVWLSIPLVLAALILGGWWTVRFKYQHARAVWSSDALTRLASLSKTNEVISRELENLKASRNAGEQQRWSEDHLLLMKNDEYLFYEFRHGFNNGLVDHLFLARGSDSRWYFSTYHFCNGMAGAEVEPPDSLADFVAKYSVRPFDGKSDECLQHTWP